MRATRAEGRFNPSMPEWGVGVRAIHGFEARINHVAPNGAVVLTERSR